MWVGMQATGPPSANHGQQRGSLEREGVGEGESGERRKHERGKSDGAGAGGGGGRGQHIVGAAVGEVDPWRGRG